jgi:hypothetical protein
MITEYAAGSRETPKDAALRSKKLKLGKVFFYSYTLYIPGTLLAVI